MNKGSTIVIALLLIVIALLVWLFVVKPVEAPTIPVGTESPAPTPTPPTNPSSTTPGPAPIHQKIVLTYPSANAKVPKKFTVTGKAPGNWFFEAQAPAMVQAPDGTKIAQGLMTAKGDWMTTNLVEFTAEISINAAYSGPATLILLKDNPSGLPQNDDSLEIPIVVQ